MNKDKNTYLKELYLKLSNFTSNFVVTNYVDGVKLEAYKSTKNTFISIFIVGNIFSIEEKKILEKKTVHKKEYVSLYPNILVFEEILNRYNNSKKWFDELLNKLTVNTSHTADLFFNMTIGGKVSLGFKNNESDPLNPKNGSLHLGIDYVPTNVKERYATVYSTTNGYVADINYNEINGNFCVIRDEYDNTHYYMHLHDRPKIHVNDKISFGQILGYVGKTGKAICEHLHYSIKLNSTNVFTDPNIYLYMYYNRLVSNSNTNYNEKIVQFEMATIPDVKNVNGFTYTKEAYDNAIKRYFDGPAVPVIDNIALYKGPAYDFILPIQPQHIAGIIVDPPKDGMVNVSLSEGHDIDPNHYCIGMMYYGNPNENKIITDMTICYFSFLSKIATDSEGFDKNIVKRKDNK